MQHFLNSGEYIKETAVIADDGSDFSILTISGGGIQEGDEVLLDIRTRTGKNALIGGNPLSIKVLQGIGSLLITDLKTGEATATLLVPGTEVKVPSDNIVYWYENWDNEESLVLRDACPGFDPKHEPHLEDLAKAAVRLLG